VVARFFSQRLPLAINYQHVKKCTATGRRPAEKRARFLAAFAVNSKKHQWQCDMKSTPNLELEIVLLFPP
jgi:hypothetical protein